VAGEDFSKGEGLHGLGLAVAEKFFNPLVMEGDAVVFF